MIFFADSYTGNLKVFLDNAMVTFTNDWTNYSNKVQDVYQKMNDSIETLNNIFGSYEVVGRKFTKNEPEKRFNRVLLEVQLFYFIHVDKSLINPTTISDFMGQFINLCQNDPEFRNSIESSTKSLDNYRIRFTRFQDLVNNSFKAHINVNPFK